MSIVFEAYSGTNSYGGDGHATLPLLRARASETAPGASGVSRFRFATQASGLAGGRGQVALPKLMATAGIGKRRGRAALPQLGSYGSAAAVIPELALGAATLPRVLAQATGHAIQTGNQSSALPRLRTRAGSLGTAVGIARLPRLGSRAGRVAAPTNYLFVVQSPGVLEAISDGGDGPIQSLADTLSLRTQAVSALITQLLLSGIGFGGVLNPLTETARLIEDRIGLAGVIEAVMTLPLADTLAVHGQLTAAEVQLLALADTLALVAAPASTQEITQLLAVVLALTDSSAAPTLQQLLSGIGLHAALNADVLALAQAQSALRLAAVAAGDLVLTAVLRDTLALTDTPLTTLELMRMLREAMGLVATVALDGQTTTAWVMDLGDKAVWSYENYPFNSFATLDGMTLAAGPEGIVELTGDSDNGAAINWRARTGLTHLGTLRLKHLDAMYLGYTSSGEIGLAVIATNDGEKVQYNYVLPARYADAVVNNRLKIGKGIESVYFAFEFTGTGPATLNDAQLLPMRTGRRK